MTLRLAVVDDDVFLKHVAPFGHPEREARLHAARRGLHAGCRLLEGAEEVQLLELPARDVSRGELERVHTADHVQRLFSIDGQHGQLDADTYHTPDTTASVRRASGGALAIVDVLGERAEFGVGLVRPPGHHATSDRAMGFCLANHAAVAAAHALENGRRRVMILDWDVHHGNGTQDIFYSRSDVLYLSLHQSPQYPGSGAAQETGDGLGEGYTVNVPLSAGADDAVYAMAFERIVRPVIEQYCPDLLIVSAGYDAHDRDPLGGMALSDRAFSMMTGQIRASLPGGGRGRLMFLLEGGYDEVGLEGAVEQTIIALRQAVVEPERSPRENVGLPWLDEVEAARQQTSRYWNV